jgi:hypothetical protein
LIAMPLVAFLNATVPALRADVPIIDKK